MLRPAEARDRPTIPEDQDRGVRAPINNPEDPSGAGTRTSARSRRELWIERDDFREEAPRKFHRLKPGSEVRLRYAYCITCNEVVKDGSGEVVELRCTYDPQTANGQTPDGRKVKGIIHWVSASHAIDAEVRLYDHLFEVPTLSEVEDDEDWKDKLNPRNLERLTGCKLEPSLGEAQPGERFQFERLGYFRRRHEGLAARRAGHEPRRLAARQLGQDREEGRAVSR